MQQRLEETATAPNRHAVWMGLAAKAGRLGYWALDTRPRRLRASPELVAILGYEAPDERWQEIRFDCLHAEDRHRVRVARRASLVSQAPFDESFRIIRPDGAVRWLRAVGRLLGDRLIGAAADITDGRAAEIDSRESRRRLAHLGRVRIVSDLSSAIVHELSQPLTSILMNAETAVRLLDAKDKPIDSSNVRQIIEDIIADDRRADLVIRRFRALLRDEPAANERLDIADLIANALVITRNQTGLNQIAVERDIAPDLPTTVGDGLQILQVLVNLIVNACDAMADVGQAQRRLRISANGEPGGGCLVTVADTGPGIRGRPVNSVFTPYTTSKAAGLGLGLSISSRIVADHGGQLWVENNYDGGATFYLRLPPPDSKQRAAPEPGALPPPVTPKPVQQPRRAREMPRRVPEQPSAAMPREPDSVSTRRRRGR